MGGWGDRGWIEGWDWIGCLGERDGGMDAAMLCYVGYRICTH